MEIMLFFDLNQAIVYVHTRFVLMQTCT